MRRRRLVLAIVLVVQLGFVAAAVVWRDTFVEAAGGLSSSGLVFAWSAGVVFVAMLAVLAALGAMAAVYTLLASALVLRAVTAALDDGAAWLVVTAALVVLQWFVVFQPANADGRRRVLVTGTVVMVLGAFAAVLVSPARPQLGLDLKGGISVRLFPVAGTDPALLVTARDIIDRRVNGLGVAEPEIAVQGNTIVVDLPGVKDRARAEQVVGTTAELQNRLVLAGPFPAGVPLTPQTTTTVPGPSTTGGASTTAGPSSTAAVSPGTTTAPTGSGAPGRTIVTRPLAAHTSTTIASPSTSAATSTSRPATTATTRAGASTTTTSAGATTTTVPSRTCEQLVPKTAPKATDTAFFWGSTRDSRGRPVECFGLGPNLLSGTSVTAARASFDPQQNGWGVDVSYRGSTFVDKIATPYVNKQVAIVLDNVVLSAPVINPGITGSDVRISGSFTERAAKDLALGLKYGSLPVRFDDKQKTVENVSPSLGRDQLRAGVAAGVIGLALVALYMLFFYRVLGLVVWTGLVLTGMIMFTLVTLLGQAQGLTLTLSGVTGIIVSVGVTVDSYVVYFERLKDEVRTGKTVRSSVDTGWKRAWRTIVAADTVSLIGAGALYALTIGSVKGFAYFLALSTIVDLVLAWCFMHPLVSIMARRPGLVRMRAMGIATGLDVARVPA